LTFVAIRGCFIVIFITFLTVLMSVAAVAILLRKKLFSVLTLTFVAVVAFCCYYYFSNRVDVCCRGCYFVIIVTF
jgi:hypothetical protein